MLRRLPVRQSRHPSHNRRNPAVASHLAPLFLHGIAAPSPAHHEPRASRLFTVRHPPGTGEGTGVGAYTLIVTKNQWGSFFIARFPFALGFT
jgi:hypothetical protein